MTVSSIYRSLWRHRLVLALLTASLAATAWYLDARQPKLYRASALVRVQQRIADPSTAFAELQTADLLAQTYTQIATTLPVAQTIERSLNGRVPLGEIAGNLEAEQVKGLDLIRLSATGHDPETVRQVAAAAPAALQAFIHRSGATDDELTTVQVPLLPTSPYAPRPLSKALLAVLLGLIFNGVLLVAYDLLADRADAGDDDRIGGRPVLAAIPTLSLTSAPALAGIPVRRTPPSRGRRRRFRG